MVVSFARGLTINCEATVDREKIRKAIKGTGKVPARTSRCDAQAHAEAP